MKTLLVVYSRSTEDVQETAAPHEAATPVLHVVREFHHGEQERQA